MQHVSTKGIDVDGWKGDRFDRPFFALLTAVESMKAWGDRGIIFASRDRATLSHTRDLMARRDHCHRIHFASDLSSCEDLVAH